MDKDKDKYKDKYMDKYMDKYKEKEKQAKRKMKSRVRFELLSKSTNQESAVYSALKSTGFEVIRQYPIFTGRKQYYADLYLPKLKLVIEVDGGYHFSEKQKRLDTNRSAGIRRLGYHVCRIKNRDTLNKRKIISIISRYFGSK